MRPASRVDRPALARRAPPRHVPGRGRHAGPRLRAGLGRRQHEHLRVLPRRGASRHRARHHALPARRPDPRPPLLAPGRDDPPRPRGRHALPAGPADQLAVPEPDPALHRQPPAHGRAAERVRVSGRGTPALAVLAATGTAHVVHEYEAPEPAGGRDRDARPHYGLDAAAALGVDPARIFKTLVASVDGLLVAGVVRLAGATTAPSARER